MIVLIVSLTVLFDLPAGNGGLILVVPGGGRQFVYSPVSVNATLHCEVNHTSLRWIVGNERYAFEVEDHRHILHSRGIFQYGTITSSLSNRTVSNLIVFGDVTENNSTRICCQVIVRRSIEESCTTTIIYDRPSPPQQVSVKPTGVTNIFNISWTSNSMVGVDQNYTIVFSSHQTESRETYYVIHNLGRLATECGLFLAYVKAVNGAGESDPSNNVTIPSLPDIEPVAASLTHQVRKSIGQIMVNVSFKPAKYCNEYPIVSYTLIVRSQQTGELLVNVSLAANETKVVLDELEGSQKYSYSVIATNKIGVSNSGESLLITSDIQAVMATIRHSMIDLQCHFIPGSDALGCVTVLVSNCSKVADKHTNISRSDMSAFVASGQLDVLHNVMCFHRVLGYGIDGNNTVSNLSIEGKVQYLIIDNMHQVDTSSCIIAIVVPTVSLLLILIAITLFCTVLLLKKKRRTITSSDHPRIETGSIDMYTNEVYGISHCKCVPKQKLNASSQTSEDHHIETTPNIVYGLVK